MKSSQQKKTGYSNGAAEIKFLLTASSLAGILLFWNWFSNKSFNDAIGAALNPVIYKGQVPNGIALNLPPMPVLDLLPTVVKFQASNVVLDSDVLSEEQSDPQLFVQTATPVQSQTTLRVVDEPTPAPIVQKIKPKIEAVEIVSQSAAGGGGGGGGKKKSSGGKAKSS